MESSRRGKLAAANYGWADLPVELLATISGRLINPRETVGFRSVCRSWRFSTPPLPNKLSLLFPLLPPWVSDHAPPEFGRSNDVCDCSIKATGVYIVRPRSDPSKAWMVSIQEPDVGKLVLRGALFYKELIIDGERELEPDWIASTQTPIARSYAHNECCLTCSGVYSTRKVVVIPNSAGCSQYLVGVYSYSSRLFAFRLDLSSSGDSEVSRYTISRLRDHMKTINHRFHDFVVFKGRIFAVDVECRIYHVDQTSTEVMELLVMNNSLWSIEETLVKFVVSDGDLYLVWRSLDQPSSSCRIYKLIILVTDDYLNDEILIEQVEDLGDKVFFITQMWSFSISARLLPYPWQRNCIFFSDHLSYSMCTCDNEPYLLGIKQSVIYDLGAKTFTGINSLKGHLDLFSPPASFVVTPGNNYLF